MTIQIIFLWMFIIPMIRACLKFLGSSSHPKLLVINRNLCLALLSSFWETKRQQLMNMKTNNNGQQQFLNLKKENPIKDWIQKKDIRWEERNADFKVAWISTKTLIFRKQDARGSENVGVMHNYLLFAIRCLLFHVPCSPFSPNE